jgi:ferredoxin
MRVEVDLEKCTGHGICESIADDVFEVQDDGLVFDPSRPGRRIGPRSVRAGGNSVPGRRAAIGAVAGQLASISALV